MNFLFFYFRNSQEFFPLYYLLPDNTTDIWPKKMLYRVHHAWAGFQLTTLVVIGTDGIGSYKSNCHTITTAACKILTIKDLQQTSLWSWRLSIAISPFQELPLLAVIKSYKEKKRKSQFHNMLFQLLPPHLCLVDSYTMRVQCLQIW